MTQLKVKKKNRLHGHVSKVAFLGVSFWVVFFWLPKLNTVTWMANSTAPVIDGTTFSKSVLEEEKDIFVPTRVAPPSAMKAVYMSSWVAGTQSIRDRVLKLADETEVNSIVVDIKDYSGKISFKVVDPELKKVGADETRIPNIREFLNELHKRGIYVIGRISVFQDQYFAKLHPEFAVLDARTDKPWKDQKGITWLDPGSKEVWDYVILIGKESWNQGFDELNFDYIRFPSDGELSKMKFTFYDSTKMDKSTQIKAFFEYLRNGFNGTGAVLSGDVFGMTTTNTDDLNIGQILEDAAEYFDYVCPMVYPSHYGSGFLGFANPASKPYEVVKYSMDEAVKKLEAASTSPLKLRPWLQDFNLGATYTADMVRKQKKAVYDAGLKSWMMWDPKNVYTRAALD
jgi:hypothetical protein